MAERFKVIIILLGLFLLESCAAPASEPTSALAVTPTADSTVASSTRDIAGTEQAEGFPCWPDGEITFEDWPNWTAVNAEPIQGHDSEWASVFVNELAAPTYLSADSPYPICAQVVKPEYFDESATRAARLTVMVKMPPGYDPEHNDWWYGIYEGSGRLWSKKGLLPDCIACHQQAAETDYMFSKEVLEASNR